MLKKTFLLFGLIIFDKLIWTFTMYEQGADVIAGRTKNDILKRRAYLVESVIFRGAGSDQMPSHIGSQFQGEWALVTYSMLSSALTNIAQRYPETRQESISLSKALIELTLSDKTRSFDTVRWGEDSLRSLDGENGHIGYLGHLNWMLSAYKFLGGPGYDDLFSKISYALLDRLKSENYKCLATYPNELRYSADNLVVIASLVNFAKLSEIKVLDDIKLWIEQARYAAQQTDSGLIPFYYDENCKPVGDARGSGAGWNSFYLPFVNSSLADEQYTLLKEQFLQRRIITGIREYRKGVSGFGDIDSGPVIFGLSPSGTGFTIGGATHAKDEELLTDLLFVSELVGSSVSWNGKKNYLFAPLVGESIMLAMKTAVVWDRRLIN